MASKMDVESTVADDMIDGYLRCGYPVFALEKIPEKWKCPYCNYVIKEPYQLTECGNRVCKGCFEARAAATADTEMICPDRSCGVRFPKTEFMVDRAFKRELDVFNVMCVHKTDENCDWSGQLRDYQEHLDKKHIHHKCKLCDEQFSSAQDLHEHRTKSCRALFTKCPIGAYCVQEMIPNERFPEHLLSFQHQDALARLVSGKITPETPMEQDEDTETIVKVNEVEKKISAILSDLAQKVQKLNDDAIDITRESIKLNELNQAAVQEVNKFQAEIHDKNSTMSAIQMQQQTMQKDIDDLREKFDENQLISTDGTLTWRIDRVAERIADAQSERELSILSPIFYSKPNGYKMRARLYPFGDGSARRTHISIFFLLMKGEYDALLKWPFGYKVTFCLFDQTGANRHVIDSFRPDVKSTSFQRPREESNVASGIPKFHPLPMLQQEDNSYVRDDTLFLKVIVDFDDTPKMLLPYMFTLNPGLPHYVQQNMINQEKNKRQTQNTEVLTTIQPNATTTNTQ